MLRFVFLLAAAIVFVLAMFGVAPAYGPTDRRWSIGLIPAGLALLTAAFLVGAWPGH